MGVLHHAEALSGVSETFDQHGSVGAAKASFNAKSTCRVADVAARKLLAPAVDERAQPRQPRPTRPPQASCSARCSHTLRACSAALTSQPCRGLYPPAARASVVMLLGSDRLPATVTAGVASTCAEMLDKSRHQAAPRGLYEARGSLRPSVCIVLQVELDRALGLYAHLRFRTHSALPVSLHGRGSVTHKGRSCVRGCETDRLCLVCTRVLARFFCSCVDAQRSSLTGIA